MTARASFWARRRAAVEAEAEADARAAQVADEAARDEALAERDDEEVLREMGLPDPALMQQGDDFAAFMSREVPEHLRRKALRTLWRSNPVLACVDGLNDYDDDYRTAAMGQGVIKTAYQVGKGMTAHLEEMARQAEAALAPPEEEAVEFDEEPVIAAAETEVTVAEAPQAVEEDNITPAPRRMRFHFEEAAV